MVTAKTTTQNASRLTTRTFNRITNVEVTESNPNGGRRAYGTILNPLSAFAGAASLAAQHEQFRIENIAVYARVDTSNANSLAAGSRISALYSAVNNSTIATYIDYDSFSTPDEAGFLGRDQMKIRSLTGGAFRLIGKYIPRCRLSDTVNSLPAMVPNAHTTWINTTFLDLDWLGMAFRVTSDNASWGGASNNCIKVQYFIKAKVSFRGMKKDVGSVLNLPSGIRIAPTEQSTPEEAIPLESDDEQGEDERHDAL